MKHEDFVTYEQAVKLKELGFDGECRAYYYDTKEISGNLIPFNYNSRDIGVISSPTLSEVQKWLREVKEIEVGVFAEFDGELRTGQWVWLMRKFNTHLFDTVFPEDINYDSYEQALSAGLDKALKLLKTENNGKRSDFR